jgi:hypothetical protein
MADEAHDGRANVMADAILANALLEEAAHARSGSALQRGRAGDPK